MSGEHDLEHNYGTFVIRKDNWDRIVISAHQIDKQIILIIIIIIKKDNWDRIVISAHQIATQR